MRNDPALKCFSQKVILGESKESKANRSGPGKALKSLNVVLGSFSWVLSLEILILGEVFKMQNSFSISHISAQTWVESRNLSNVRDMNYQDLADDDLVRECGENPCPEALEEFIRRFQPLIGKVALRACREWSVTALDVVEDRVQDTFVKIFANNCALLKRFQSRHEKAFFGYLKVVTANLVYDWFRKHHPIDDITDELNPDIDPIRGHHDERGGCGENEIFLNEINVLLKQRGNGPAEERERTIFWLYYRQGWTAKEIAAIPAMSLSTKGVESVIHRLIQYVKEVLVMEGYVP